jgi:hypothetical protein
MSKMFLFSMAFLLVGCAAKSTPSSINKSTPSSINITDNQLGSLLAEGRLEQCMRMANDILISERPKKTKEAAAYWRDLSMALMSVDMEDNMLPGETPQIDKVRWQGVSSEVGLMLIHQLLRHVKRQQELAGKNQNLLKRIAKLEKDNIKLRNLLEQLEDLK